MSLKPLKIAIFLLITLLTTNLVSAFGIVACESGCSSDIHQNNHHDSGHHDDSCKGSFISSSPHLNESEDTCIDYLIQLSEGLYKSTENINPTVNLPVKSAFDTRPTSANFYMYACHSYLKSSQIISQNILVRRSVVLLI